MRTRIDQARRFLRSPLGVKLYRYVMGSVITTVVSFGVLTLVYGVLRLWSAVPSTVFANVVATVPAYWLNRTWTWGKAGRSDLWREVLPFWVLSILGIVISMGTAAVAGDVARTHHLGHLASIVVVDGANLAAYGTLFIGKYLVFERLFRAAEAVRSARRAPEPVVADAVTQVPAPATAASTTSDRTALAGVGAEPVSAAAGALSSAAAGAPVLGPTGASWTVAVGTSPTPSSANGPARLLGRDLAGAPATGEIVAATAPSAAWSVFPDRGL